MLEIKIVEYGDLPLNHYFRARGDYWFKLVPKQRKNLKLVGFLNMVIPFAR
jgi:hypothetical protein